MKAGIKSGENKKKMEIIKNMLKENLPIDLISKITGASQKEIKKMKWKNYNWFSYNFMRTKKV